MHGDLKQTNALYDEHQQRVRLIDFGNAQSAPFHGRADIAHLLAQLTTSPAGIGGTPGYRAPETLRGFADLSADMYSAGCIIASLVRPHTASPACDLSAQMFQTVWRTDVCNALYDRAQEDCWYSHHYHYVRVRLTRLGSVIVGREPVLWSEDAWDLMQRLLAPAHGLRPSAAVCLQHKYFITHNDKLQRSPTQ